jgi:hypothetical protein
MNYFSIILLALIIIVIVIIIISSLKTKKEDFNVLSDPDFKNIYDSTCEEIIDEGLMITKNYLTLGINSDKIMKKRAKKRCDEFFTKLNGDKEKITQRLPKELMNIFISELQNIYKGPIPSEIIDWTSTELTAKAHNYLVFQYQKYDPIVGGHAVDEPAHKFVHHEDYLDRKIPVGHDENILIKTINKDYNNLFVNKVPAPMNTDKLIFGIKRYGNPPGYKSQKIQDLRGYSEGQMKLLLKAGGTKDPHSLRRAGHTDVMSQLIAGKGLANEEFADKYIEQHARKIGDKEYKTFDHIKDRFIDRSKTDLYQKSRSINDNISNEIVLGNM